MKSLLKWLKRQFFEDSEPDEVIEPDIPPDPEPVSRGKVVRELKRAEYRPDASRTGGRVVKAMPRELRKIKEAQERIADETDL